MSDSTTQAWYAGLGAARIAIVAVLGTFFLLFHLQIAVYGMPSPTIFLPTHLCVALTILFLAVPERRLPPLVDWILAALSLVMLGYYLSIAATWERRLVLLSATDYVAGFLIIFLVLEAVRRTIGWVLVILPLMFILHALYANHFPGFLFGPPTSVRSILTALYLGDAGILGTPVAVVAEFVVVFILFSIILAAVGSGVFFTRLAVSMFGRSTGGPAKAAVVSSALVGSLSGSAIANVLTTGSFTIPLMKRLGYRPAFAAGAEAAASTGGMIMPPMMGATAFLMAEFMGVTYAAIVLAAVIPAILFFFGVFCHVHFEAKRAALGELHLKGIVKVPALLLREGYLALPLVGIIVMLVMGYSIVLVAIAGSIGALLLGSARAHTRIKPGQLVELFQQTARTTVSLTAACAAAGIVIGAIYSTGLSFRIAQSVMGFAEGQLWIILIAGGLMAMIMGMGMTASAVYITMVATVIPILRTAGVPEMAAHMFAFYFGIASGITPPIALSAYAAAPLAGASPIQTGIQASRIGLAIFILPLVFVHRPEILMIGAAGDIVFVTGSVALGLLVFAMGAVGYSTRALDPARRLVYLAVSMLLLFPEPVTTWLGLAGVVILAAESLVVARYDRARVKRRAVAAKPAADGASVDLTELFTDQPHPVPEERGRGIVYGWLLLLGAAFVMGALGSNAMHARQPFVWLSALAALAVVLVAGLHLLRRQFRDTRPPRTSSLASASRIGS